MRRAGTTDLATRGSLGSRATLAHTYTYTYDSRDNILTNSESGGVVQMNYDAASRLTTSTLGGVTTTYTFDSNGNLAGVNEAGTLTTMVYDKENRLKEYRQGAAANTRTVTYDLNSLKQSETVSKATNQLVWDGADMLGEVPAVKPVGAPTMPIRYDSGQGIMFATTRFEPDPTRTDTGADFIGSILIDFDENGDFTDERRYKPYGELLAGTATTYGWTGNTGSRATLLQYAEQYNRRRHYSTKLKQWTTRDPLWPDESAYGYVRGGPMTWNDPSGESPGKKKKKCYVYWCDNLGPGDAVHARLCVKIENSSHPNDGANRSCNWGFFTAGGAWDQGVYKRELDCKDVFSGSKNYRCRLIEKPDSDTACAIADGICKCQEQYFSRATPRYDIAFYNCRTWSKEILECGCNYAKSRGFRGTGDCYGRFPTPPPPYEITRGMPGEQARGGPNPIWH